MDLSLKINISLNSCKMSQNSCSTCFLTEDEVLIGSSHSSEKSMQLDVRKLSLGRRHLVNTYEVKANMV